MRTDGSNAFVYILTNYTRSVLYVGVTNNLARRLYEHKNHLVDGFTKKYNVTTLVYYEVYENIADAIQREKLIKKKSRIGKIRLIIAQSPKPIPNSKRWRLLFSAV